MTLPGTTPSLFGKPQNHPRASPLKRGRGIFLLSVSRTAPAAQTAPHKLFLCPRGGARSLRVTTILGLGIFATESTEDTEKEKR